MPIGKFSKSCRRTIVPGWSKQILVRVIAAGAALGFVLSAVCGRFIQKLLFGVRPLDLATFAAVTIVLGTIAALSIVGPAWRAARIDPAEALRNT